MGLGVTLTTLQSGTEARAEDVNNDLAALNGASAPSFTTLTVLGGTNVTPMSVSATNNGGTAVAALQNSATNNANTDMLDLQRLSNQPQTFTLGVDPFGQFYVYDQNAAAFALVGIKAGSPVVTNRNGTGLLAVPIYTGYTGGANPSNPPTGSIRIDA